MLNIDVDLIEDLRFTRCLGNHALKEFYSEYELYKNATNCPVIAEPDTVVYDSFKSDFCGFLLLFTKGLDQAIRDSGLLRVDSDADDFEISEAVNELLCYMVAEEMFQHETIEQVSQAVVDRVTHRHHELHTRPDHSVFLRRDDITLLIRNFRHPLQKAGDKKTAPTLFDGLPGLKEAKISDIAKKFEPLSIDLGKTESTVTQVSADVLSIRSEEESHNLNDMSIDESLATSSSSRTDVSDYIIESNDRQQLPLDDRGCVYAYVSFTDLKEQVLKSSKAFKTIQDFI